MLYFYPKDNTPGCTTEAMQFRDKYKDFVKAGAAVFGVSRDNMKSHDEFKTKLELPFELIADTEEKMCHMFGVVKNKIMYGKKVKGIERSTFLIGADGTGERRMARPQGSGPRGRRAQSCQSSQKGRLSLRALAQHSHGCPCMVLMHNGFACLVECVTQFQFQEKPPVVSRVAFFLAASLFPQLLPSPCHCPAPPSKRA